MAILRLTERNLRFLKTLLMSDFEMKSGHCDECIAALCGFKTYASMRNAIKSQEARTANEVTFEGFEQRCLQFSYDRKSNEYLRLIFRNIVWPDLPWIVHKSNDNISADDWYYKCQSSDFPFIRIKEQRKYRTLEWDCITLTSASDQHTREEAGDDLVRRLHSTYQLICRGLDRKSFFDGSAFCGVITGLSESSARQLANSFAVLLAPLASRTTLDGVPPHSHSIVPGGLLV